MVGWNYFKWCIKDVSDKMMQL